MAEKNTELLKRGTSWLDRESLARQCFSMCAWQTACTSTAWENCWNKDSRTTGVQDSNSIEHFSDWPKNPALGVSEMSSWTWQFQINETWLQKREGIQNEEDKSWVKMSFGCLRPLPLPPSWPSESYHLGFNFGNLLLLPSAWSCLCPSHHNRSLSPE